ncbi:MAG: alpha/beta hydrolase [Firmicutes bacterium]|nr:alpha/beta hydrolase [Bacillota bacterium]
MKRTKKILLILLIVIAIVVFGIFGYIQVSTYMPSDDAKLIISEIDKTNNLYIFEPEEAIANFIFYPGGFVDERAYAVLLDGLRNEGIRVFLVSMPFKLAITNSDAAKKIHQTYPSELPWYIIGHSLGGASASIFLNQNPDWIDGLILLAAYPADSSDLSSSGYSVLSIYGDQDLVLDVSKLDITKPLLPSNTEYHVIIGGNHAYFGNYGEQKGDGEASITRELQQALTIERIVTFLANNT